MSEKIDPRVLRTRKLLYHALDKLLKKIDFSGISVQDIADAASVNRVTFYDHFADKFALLEWVIRSRFEELLAKRGVEFSGCSTALAGIVLAVCDYLAGAPLPMEPHMEAAVVSALRGMTREGLEKHPGPRKLPVPVVAAAWSGAVYGAAREWARMPNRPAAEEIAGPLVQVLGPLLGGSGE